MAVIFVSYTRVDAKDKAAHRFFQDLRRKMAEKLGCSEEEALFIDSSNIQAGETWAARLSEELSCCQCFVALVSPEYIASPNCGKEWAAFSLRLGAMVAPPAVRIPLLWQPCLVPDAIGATQLFSDATAPNTEDRGLRYLLHREPTAYEAVLSAFSNRLHEVILRHPIARARPPVDFSAAPNAFAPATTVGWRRIAIACGAVAFALAIALFLVRQVSTPSIRQRAIAWSNQLCPNGRAQEGAAPVVLPSNLSSLGAEQALAIALPLAASCPEVADALTEHASRALGPHPDVLALQARSLYRQGRYVEAIDVLTKAIALRPEDGDLYYQRGRANLASGNRPGYEKDLSTACGRRHAQACDLLGGSGLGTRLEQTTQSR